MATLQKIIDAEKEAARLVGEAEALRAGEAERIKSGQDALLLREKDRADRAVAEAEQAQREMAEKETAGLRARTEERLASLRERFAAAKGEYGDRLFRMALGEEDER